jgi:glycosyltransferase involved in cell wall biosynthesis
MKISYAITVCNEHVEIQRLVSSLLQNKRSGDEIVVLFDSTNGTQSVEDYLRAKSVNCELSWSPYQFDGDFAKMKNHLNSMCTGDWIFNIDADEIPHKNLFLNLPDILEENAVDMIRVPRVNTVEGLTQDHIQKWGWNVNERGWVNWADWQMRIYRNIPTIKWKNKVHEVLEGFQKHSMLPAEEEWALYHPKTIERQERQNDYYNSL